MLLAPGQGTNDYASFEIATLARGDGWRIEGNHTLDAVLVSNDDTTVPIRKHLAKEKVVAPPPPTLEWMIDPIRYPEAMRLAASSRPSAGPSTDLTTPKGKKPRVGSGSASPAPLSS